MFHTLFVRYGGGSTVFQPLLRWKHWNTFAWALIVIGTLGWVVTLIAWNL